MEDFDVLIVGGGPAGLSAAERIAASGARVLVVHKDPSIGEPVCTSGGSWAKEMKELGIPENLYQPMSTLVFASSNRTSTITFGNDHAVVLDVTGTYRYLAGLAEAAGARIECGTSFLKVLDNSDSGLTCLVSHGSEQREVHARFVVDASGFRRSVLTSLGLGNPPRRFGTGTEIEFENLSDNKNQATLFVGTRFAPAGYGWIFPTRLNTVRVGIGVIRPDTTAQTDKLLSDFLKSPTASDLGVRVGKQVQIHRGVIPSDGAISKFVYGRVIAVGDAAGQALPLVGEGIRYSIRSGRQAGENIVGALYNEARYANHLKKYETWWNKRYRRSFRLAQKVNERISSHTDAKWDRDVALLDNLNGDQVARMLRMELTVADALNVAVRRFTTPRRTRTDTPA